MSSEGSDAASQSSESDDEEVASQESNHSEAQAQAQERDLQVLLELSDHMLAVRERMLQRFSQFRLHGDDAAQTAPVAGDRQSPQRESTRAE